MILLLNYYVNKTESSDLFLIKFSIIGDVQQVPGLLGGGDQGQPDGAGVERPEGHHHQPAQERGLRSEAHRGGLPAAKRADLLAGGEVRAAAAGQVIIAKASGWNGGYGSYIVIKHQNGTQTLYGHLSRVDVVVGEKVTQTETIGAIGNSGKSTGPHLHFEVRGGKNPF